MVKLYTNQELIELKKVTAGGLVAAGQARRICKRGGEWLFCLVKEVEVSKQTSKAKEVKPKRAIAKKKSKPGKRKKAGKKAGK